MKRICSQFSRALALGLIALLPLSSIHAQTRNQGASNAQLPPALQAAVLSGNPQSIARAISTLSGGNPQQMANLSVQVVNAAERLLATNPQASVSAAAAAVEIVRNAGVIASAPDQTLTTVTTAARIILSPEAQRIAPAAVAQIAINVTAVAANPAVYQANPSAAIQVMANAYAAASSQSVNAAAPQAVLAVTQSLTQASTNQGLNQANPTNAAQISAILNNQAPKAGTTASVTSITVYPQATPTVDPAVRSASPSS